MKHWQKTKQSRWSSGMDNIYWENFNLIIAYIAMFESIFFSYFQYFKTAHIDVKEDARWICTKFFFFAKSVLIVLIKIFNDEVVKKMIEKD